ncbi:alpha/beta fold hydrolase [Thaumasiovibrio sp. DFM-14]|uniref:alpha/beta fold hydrolase n=1 Tax=Thaumasiovibrio sp. DFM-14 TaxID=3384792 RepID=UPI0039A19FA9
MIERNVLLRTGLQMAYLCSDKVDPEKPNIVFVHGWQDNAASFFNIVPLLKQSCNLWVVDLNGHGYSSHKGSESYYYFYDYVDDLASFLDEIQLHSLHLVGHSLGGLISACYAAAFPAKVQSICLIEALVPLYETAEATVQRLRYGILSRDKQRNKNRRMMRSHEQAIQLRQRVTPIKETLLRPMIERGTEVTRSGVRWRHDPKLQTDSLFRLTQEQSKAIVTAVECSVTMILGTDGFSSLKDPNIQAWYRNLTLHSVKGGHHCHLENPKSVAELIKGQIQKVNTC